MTNSSKETFEIIEDLGNRIIRCQEKCDGVENNQEKGYYPRAFFLEPENANQVQVAVIGENPGNSSCLEREFYKALAERNDSGHATFGDCQRVWRSIAEQHDYYKRSRHLLQELGLDLNGLLWTEIVFCEKSLSARRIPRETYDTCVSRFLKEIVKLVPKRKHVVCLGKSAFEYVRTLSERDIWKVIGVDHPTGSFVFANYFKKESGKKVTERKLKQRLGSKFSQLEKSQETYIWNMRNDARRI